MLDDIALFIHIARRRSLAGAAGHLGVPAATVTRRLRKLEEDLGAQLVHRSARKFALTAEGEAYFEAFADLVDQAETTLRGLSNDLHALQGGLKVAAPTNISVGMLQPMWSAFVKTYPEIRLTLTLSNENTDLLERQVDLALRAGPQTDLRLYQQKLGSIATVMVASPGYLAGIRPPSEPGDLAEHKMIKVVALAQWELSNAVTGAGQTVHLNPCVSVDDIGLARQLAVDGHGVALLPVSEVAGDLREGRLRQVLCDWQGPARDIFVVWPTGRLLSARAKCLRDHIVAWVAREPLFRGTLTGGGQAL